MSAKLVANSYGKSEVRVTRVTRHPDRHELKELTVATRLEGDFAESYTAGDNRKVVATDSMRNTVYVLAKTHGIASVEDFGLALANHFLKEYPHVASAAIELGERLWQRIAVNGKPSPHAFVGGGDETRTCAIVARRDGVRIQSGLTGLLVLKTTDSAFRDFVRDRFTTLADADDRIFATIVTATWIYNTPAADWDACHAAIRNSLLEVFATHKSLGVQQTLFAMGEAALKACPQIDEIEIEMPNKHRIPFNLQPFGLENKNEVFVATDEPYGLIRGTIRR